MARKIVLLRDLEGYSIEAIAARLGRKRERAKWRLHRTRQLARQFLDPACDRAQGIDTVS